MMELILIKNAWGNLPQVFKEKGCEEMIYEYWYTIGARDAIHRIERYKIQSLESVIHNKRLYYKVAIQDKVLMILKYPDMVFQGYATPKRNFEVVTDDFISRITMEIAKIMVKMGELDAGGSESITNKS